MANFDAELERRRRLLGVDDAFVVSLLTKCNPFAFTLENGHSMFFTRDADAYLHLMVTTYMTFPKGYIELPYLVSILYKNISFKNAKTVAMFMKPWFDDDVFQITGWQGKQGRIFMERLATALTSFNCVSFNHYDFDEAFKLFEHRVELDKLRNEANIKDGL